MFALVFLLVHINLFHLDLLSFYPWSWLLYVRFIVSIIGGNWCDFAFLGKLRSIFNVLEEVWLDVNSVVFVDAFKSLGTLDFFGSFCFLMLLMNHIIIGPHLHNLICQNMLILHIQLNRARILFSDLSALRVICAYVRLALDLFQSWAIISIDHSK